MLWGYLQLCSDQHRAVVLLGDVMVVYEQYISKNAPLNHPQNAHEDDENKIGK